MPMKKIGVSLPSQVLAEVDQAAKERGETRSGFIANVLRRVARLKQDRGVTEEINRLFADGQIVQHQRETAQAFARGSGDRGGLLW